MKLEPGMAYDTKVLNKIFAFLSVLFLISVIWMMLDDFIRPWKGFQIKSMDVKREELEKEIKTMIGKVDKQKLQSIQQEIEAGKKLLEQRSQEIKDIDKKLSELSGALHAARIVRGDYNSKVSATTFQWEMALEHGDPRAPELKDNLTEYQAKFIDAKEKMKLLDRENKDLKQHKADMQKELTAAEKKQEDLIGQVKLAESSLDKAKVNPVGILRNLPMLDYLDPTLRINQVVLDNLTDDRYFQNVPKVDRCMTCHVFIDTIGHEKDEQPFRTHPQLDLFVGTDSPHALKKFGCTTCHGGEGHRVNDFQSVAHTPQNEMQEKVWKEKYHWHEPHKVVQPMYRLQHTEAACLKCHQGVERVPMANKLNRGRDLIETNGCYACHKIEGWDHLRKPGPSLAKLASKLDKNWVKNWIWAPTNFNSHAKMPTFFNQSNNNRPDFLRKNVTEVNAIAEYLWENSKESTPVMKFAAGDLENGKKLISTVGCLGCHQVEGLDDQYMQSQNRRGPYLSGIGSKVSGDWLVSWLKNPHSYDENTIMPSLRLSDQEANDIATYLLSLKNEKFRQKVFDDLDDNLRDELLENYLAAFDTMENAHKAVAKMSDHEKTMELGKRSIGKYGCFSCHQIEGFDGRAPIGPELTYVGTKPVEQFGFGHEHIAHQRDAWITSHLKNPRRWDRGVNKSFDDLLRMPKFNLADKDIESIVMALLGQSIEKVPLKGQKRLSAEEQIYERGMRIVRQKNCIGCHKVDGMGGEITKNYQDDLMLGPPYLVQEGHRVQADWLHNFLANVQPIRPWLAIRMPTFKLSNEERNLIVEGFKAKANQVTFEEKVQKVEWEPGEREAAVTLFNNLACTSCHSQGFDPKIDPMAPDLHKVNGRLRQSWVEKWLQNPAAILPYTTMPSFWEGGVSSEPTVLEGNVEKQIKAVAKYVVELSQQNH